MAQQQCKVSLRINKLFKIPLKIHRWQLMAMGLAASLRSMKRSSVRRRMRRTRWRLYRFWFGISVNKHLLQIELVVQGRTILVSEKLLCQHSVYFRSNCITFQLLSKLMLSRQVFNDFDENQETVVLKHKELGGEDLLDEKQHEPLSMIRKGLFKLDKFNGFESILQKFT